MIKTLSVIVPFYNESKTIAKCVEDLELLNESVPLKCIFVNDGSEDKSQEVLTAALNESALSYTLVKKENEGKAAAIKSALRHLNTSHVVIFDADLELNSSDIALMWERVTQYDDNFVFGFRDFRAHSSFTYRYTLANRLLSNLFGVIYNQVITDMMCGLKLMPVDFLIKVPFRFGRFALEFEIPWMMWKSYVRPYEIAVSYKPRGWEDGKTIGYYDALQIIVCMVRGRFIKRN